MFLRSLLVLSLLVLGTESSWAIKDRGGGHGCELEFKALALEWLFKLKDHHLILSQYGVSFKKFNEAVLTTEIIAVKKPKDDDGKTRDAVYDKNLSHIEIDADLCSQPRSRDQQMVTVLHEYFRKMSLNDDKGEISTSLFAELKRRGLDDQGVRVIYMTGYDDAWSGFWERWNGTIVGKALSLTSTNQVLKHQIECSLSKTEGRGFGIIETTDSQGRKIGKYQFKNGSLCSAATVAFKQATPLNPEPVVLKLAQNTYLGTLVQVVSLEPNIYQPTMPENLHDYSVCRLERDPFGARMVIKIGTDQSRTILGRFRDKDYRKAQEVFSAAVESGQCKSDSSPTEENKE